MILVIQGFGFFFLFAILVTSIDNTLQDIQKALEVLVNVQTLEEESE